MEMFLHVFAAFVLLSKMIFGMIPNDPTRIRWEDWSDQHSPGLAYQQLNEPAKKGKWLWRRACLAFMWRFEDLLGHSARSCSPSTAAWVMCLAFTPDSLRRFYQIELCWSSSGSAMESGSSSTMAERNSGFCPAMAVGQRCEHVFSMSNIIIYQPSKLDPTPYIIWPKLSQAFFKKVIFCIGCIEFAQETRIRSRHEIHQQPFLQRLPRWSPWLSVTWLVRAH